jgi:hypothetical protein
MNFRIIFALLLFSPLVFAVNEQRITVSPDEVTKVRTHSAQHYVAGAKNMTMFWLSGLEADCNSVYFYNDIDPFLYSTVMTGLTKDNISSVEIIYDVDSRGSWDSEACKLTSFSIN